MLITVILPFRDGHLCFHIINKDRMISILSVWFVGGTVLFFIATSHTSSAHLRFSVDVIFL